MSYPILSLSEESGSEASAKLHFSLATARATGADFLRVDFLCAEEKRAKLRPAILRALRERKKNGKIMFFVLSEDFLSPKAEAELVANKYPAMREDRELLNTESGYILIKI